MFKIGELIAFRPDLLLGTKYGTVTYTPTLSEYKNDILRVVRITTAGTACCQVYKTNSNSFYKRGKEVSTIHESMIVRPKFSIYDNVYIDDNYLKFMVSNNIISQVMAENLIGTRVGIMDLVYHKDGGFFYVLGKVIPNVLDFKSQPIPENSLSLEYESLNDYEYENRLQEQKVADSGGESYEGCGVHGKSLQSKISIGRLGDSEGIRGS